MSQPSGAGDEVGRCPSCGARVVPGQDWCTLCLQPLRAAPGGAAPAESEVLDGTGDLAAPGPADAARPVGPPDAAGPTGPADPADPYASAAEGAPGRPAGDLPPSVAEAMLAQLAASSAADRPLGRGPLSGTRRGVRLALGCGAAVVLVGVLLLVLTLVGMLL